MKSLRTVETEIRHQKVISTRLPSDDCHLCNEKSIIEFQNWRIIPNNFPYDALAKIHHMIIPKNHVKELELSNEAKEELMNLKNHYLDDTYEYILEPLPKRKSIPAHHHLHLLVTLDHYRHDQL